MNRLYHAFPRVPKAFSLARISILALAYFLLLPSTAHAYLDPGTGSMLVSALIGIFATVLFLIKGIWYRGLGFLYAIMGQKQFRTHDSIVFYSEGGQYWNVFQPILEGLATHGEPCTYLTSDEQDPALVQEIPGVTTRYIGKGNKAFATMNTLEADLCVMTTPGLDVLQIRRSPGVKHYSHVVHMAGDTSMYRLYGLDYYDSLLASGPHQEQSVRILEQQRGTAPKQILLSGCPYFDVLMRMKENTTAKSQSTDKSPHILVAPTWGDNGLLSKYGTDLLLPLARAGYTVTVRPHPQSRIVETTLLDNLQQALAAYTNVQWDFSSNNFEAMCNADVLISDYSCIIYDFAFVMERPVLTMDFTPDLSAYDAFDLPEAPWDIAMLTRLGKRITLEDVPRIPAIINELLEQPELQQILKAFRDAHVYNFGHAGPIMAEQLLSLRDQARQISSH